MNIVWRPLTPLAAKSDLTDKGIHPKLQQAYQRIVQEQKAPAKGAGKLWQLDLGEKYCNWGKLYFYELQSS